MVKTGRPRYGSLQFSPRKKAKRQYAKVRFWADAKETKPLGFAGYKVGMIHVIATDTRKSSTTSGDQIAIPATIIECPPIKINSARFYKKKGYGREIAKEVFFKVEKELRRKIKTTPNEKELDQINPKEYSHITITVYTQPKLAGFGKKKPELFEVHLGGTDEEKLSFIKENKDKEIFLEQVLQENQYTDIHAVTKGKGTQGPVKRFGIGLKSHKSEKGRRAPGAMGGWIGQQHWMWKVPKAGQTGFHQRTEYNKQILKIMSPDDLPSKEYHKYGKLKSKIILVKGSVAGSKKRLIILTNAIRAKDKPSLPIIETIVV
ncbi:MAG: 50S ribosomal protein L3 [Nanoarchaeota archaeon]|nr:50S ribosomal protein L3 [Nanoarchaeota archaeon]MBU1030506.1 50S ribosomal protein L3 [Nanoarchaeota archaeon]MBU1850482.1 50S ribosomal protein L3 [Nanoarchaeota archaeon]